MNDELAEHGVQGGFNRRPPRAADDGGEKMLKNARFAGVGFQRGQFFPVKMLRTAAMLTSTQPADSLIAVKAVPLALMAIVCPSGDFTEVFPPPTCTQSGLDPTAQEISISCAKDFLSICLCGYSQLMTDLIPCPASTTA